MAWSISASVTESGLDYAKNTSVVTVNLYVSWNYSSYALDSPAYGITINGSKKSGRVNFNTNIASSGSQLIASYPVTVTHTTDGSKTIDWSAYYDGSGSGRQSTSGRKVLTKIPRASSITVSKSSVQAGEDLTFTTVKKVSSYTDNVTYSLGSNSVTVQNVPSNTAYTFNIPLAWMTAIPNSASGTVTVTVTTKNGSTTIGTNSARFTVNVPANIVPTGTRTLAPVSATTDPFSTYTDAYIRYFKLLGVSYSNVQSYYGATIKSIKTVIRGSNGESSHTGTETTLSYNLEASGDVYVSTVITDSRGRTATIAEEAINVIDYFSPVCSLSGQASNGGYALNVKANVAPVSISGTGVNAKKYKIDRWLYESPSNVTTIASGNLTDYKADFVILDTGIDTSLTYVYKVYIYDTVTGDTTTTATLEYVTGRVVMSRHVGGDGITFGAEATSGGLVLHKWDFLFSDVSEGSTFVSDILALLGNWVIV